MRALLVSSTFFALALMLILSVINALRLGDGEAETMWTGLRRFLSQPGVVAVLLIGAGLNTAFVTVAGYIDPRDYICDEVAARQFLNHSTMYPRDLPQRGITELAAPIRGRAVIKRLPGVQTDLNSLKDPPVLANAHLPLLGILLAIPVKALGLRGSFLLLVVLYAILLYWSLTAILHELFGAVPPLFLAGILGLVLGWYSVGTTLRAAQPSILILALVTASWLLLRRGRQWEAGASIGVAVWIHAFPALLLIYLAARHRRAFVAASLTISAIGCAILALTGSETLKEWSDTIHSTSNLYVPQPGNVSLAGLITTLGHSIGHDLRGDIVGPAMALVVAAILAAFLWPWNRSKTDLARVDVEYAVSVTAMLLASPISWSRYFPILLLPLAMMVHYRRRSGRWVVPVFVLVLMLLAIPDSVLALWGHYAGRVGGSLVSWLLISIPSFALITVFGWTLQLSPKREQRVYAATAKG